MSGDVAVQNLPPAMLDAEEAVEQLKCKVGTAKKSNATIASR